MSDVAMAVVRMAVAKHGLQIDLDDICRMSAKDRVTTVIKRASEIMKADPHAQSAYASAGVVGYFRDSLARLSAASAPKNG